MSKWEKLLNRILSLSNDLRFDEVKKVLESYGYVMRQPSTGSSHCIFRKIGCRPVSIPKEDPVKKVYVKLVKEAIEEAIANNEGIE